MTAGTMFGGAVDSQPDRFAGLDERLPVPLLRYVAETRHADLATSLAAVMEIALRRTTDPARVEVARRPAHGACRAGRYAVVEPDVLPADIGSRFLLELRDLVGADEPRREGARENVRARLADDPPDAAAVSESLARTLGLTSTICRAALATALTAIDTHGWDALDQTSHPAPARRVPSQRAPDQPDLPSPTGDPAALAPAPEE